MLGLRKNLFRPLILCLISLALLLLNGCHRQKPEFWHEEVENRLPRHPVNGTDSMALVMQKRLAKDRVRVLSMGDLYLVSIPARRLFADQSPRLTWKSYATLNDVACYLRQYRKVSIQVTAYTSKYVSTRRERALSLARASAVADYLWSQGIETRLVFAYGQGSHKPIVKKVPFGDHSPNARIEITFKRMEA